MWSQWKQLFNRDWRIDNKCPIKKRSTPVFFFFFFLISGIISFFYVEGFFLYIFFLPQCFEAWPLTCFTSTCSSGESWIGAHFGASTKRHHAASPNFLVVTGRRKPPPDQKGSIFIHTPIHACIAAVIALLWLSFRRRWVPAPVCDTPLHWANCDLKGTGIHWEPRSQL